MIKKVFIRVLLIFMVLAFLGVVTVQWLWIKNAMKERENRFSSKVYDVLNKVVYRVDNINYTRYYNEMRHELGNYENYNEIIKKQHGVNGFNSSAYLFEFVMRSQDRTFLSINIMPSLENLTEDKMRNEEILKKSINSLNIDIDKGDDDLQKRLNIINERFKERMFRLMRERDPQRQSIDKLLENVPLRSLLEEAFKLNNVNLDYRFEVLTREQVMDKAGNAAGKFYYVPLFPYDYVKKDYYLGVTFASIQPVILENMSWLFLGSAFCILGLLAVFIITILTIMRQQKLSVIKNDFINNMTHEFKTPIATISLATSAISKEKVLEDKKQLLNFNAIIKDANSRMDKYVERILQQAKLDRREIYINKTEVNMNDLIEKAAGHFMLQAQERGGTLEIDALVDSFIYYADEVHMLNAISNLLDNAIKYSVGPPNVRIFTRETADGYVIGVEDHGIGISKEAQKKVFKRFYRVPNGNIHDVKGFGLGLSYVKSIVELHGGTVRLTSRKNQGTIVEMILK